MRNILALVASLVILLTTGSEAAGQGATATVTVVHALPRLTADVYVNGKLTLDGFRPETATDPLELPAGQYDIAIREAGAPSGSDPALEGTVTAKADDNLSIIAHLNRDGRPELTVFKNDGSRIASGMARLVVRHVGVAPALDLLIDRKAAFSRVRGGGEAAKVLDEGPHLLEVRVAGSMSPLLKPAELVLKEGTVHIIYVMGSRKDQTLDLMQQNLGGVATLPSTVLGGDGGRAADRPLPGWVFALATVIGLSCIVSAVGLACSARGKRELL